ncbi:hypothetical protein NQ314_010185 [Rhamnusium bicolor]|uniref:PiggyBac transposable element-derived protein domain-containing protein n=1 Tax=Rhamnusium bicolor TaxID=1586634 RepID=A0AAV8XSC7_9CUCU|nr:hypothetical protein NQ314_010185 [Rhamnusium bicolor]
MINLLVYLRENGYTASGTMRENRVPKECPLLAKKDFAKTGKKGDHISIIERTNGIIFTRWLDNSVVTVASNCYGISPMNQVKRYSRKDKKHIQVSRPFVIGEYNSGMGGTDLMDGGVNCYRIGIRSKKWWWCIFTWLIDVSIVNAWIIQRKSGKAISQLDFRREIVNVYLTRYGNAPKRAGRPSTSKNSITLNRISDDLRYDRQDHLLVEIPEKKKRRCAGEGCCSIIRTMCKKCNVGLCLPCNYIFHTK